MDDLLRVTFSDESAFAKGDDAGTFIWCHKKDEGLEKSSKNGAGEMKVITSTVNAQV